MALSGLVWTLLDKGYNHMDIICIAKIIKQTEYS